MSGTGILLGVKGESHYPHSSEGNGKLLSGNYSGKLLHQVYEALLANLLPRFSHIRSDV